MIKTALISVYDKRGIIFISRFLQEKGVDIISTGGTFKYLKENGIKVREVSDVTGFEEILDGRVKTLHPNIHGGILAKRDNKKHIETLNSKDIKPIDMVIVNLYPFFHKVNEQINFEEKMEFIDIGGPTMIRAAAKNFKDVIVLTDVDDYKNVINQIDVFEDVDLITRRKLAGKVFNLMSAYDGAISKFLLQDDYPKYLSMSYEKNRDLRYGENPHQTAAFYTSTLEEGAMKDFIQLNGKELSYNNIKDMDIAWRVVGEFERTACCTLKHNSPCGVALGNNVYDAYKKAYNCDPISIFGGIVAFNEQVDKATAQEISKIFLEIIIAPDFTEDALEVLKHKKNLRVIKCNVKCKDKFDIAKVDGGILVQHRDNKLLEQLKVVTKEKPCKEQIENMIFAMKVVKYVKSNAIVVAKDMQAIGISGGQVNRIWSACEALNRGREGIVLASDGFLPFKDVVQETSKYKIKSIIQPGGSIRDRESIDECDKYKISMIFTGSRHFKH